MDSELSASVRDIVRLYTRPAAAANLKNSIQPTFELAMRNWRQSLSVPVETALDSAAEPGRVEAPATEGTGCF